VLKALSLSQIALAYEAEVHPNVVGRLERGEYNPTVALLLLLVKPLRVSLSDLIAAAERRGG
jgi:transcriptional regulator with XRE-family HTH domain